MAAPATLPWVRVAQNSPPCPLAVVAQCGAWLSPNDSGGGRWHYVTAGAGGPCFTHRPHSTTHTHRHGADTTGDASLRAEDTQAPGDQGTKRGDARPSSWLLPDPPLGAGAKPCSPLVVAAPPSARHCRGDGTGRSREARGSQTLHPKAAPTFPGAEGCRASAAPPLEAPAFAPLSLPGAAGPWGLGPGLAAATRGEPQQLPSLREGREGP